MSLLLSSVIAASLAHGPTPAETVVVRSLLRFEAVELRLRDAPDLPTYRLAVQLENGWWTGPSVPIAAHDGHTCHEDERTVKRSTLRDLPLASKRRAVVAQLDVDVTTYATCPPDEPPTKPVVARWTERVFLVCAATTAGDALTCAPPIVTRTRERCTAKATLVRGALHVPCEAYWLDDASAAHDLGRGKHTLDL